MNILPVILNLNRTVMYSYVYLAFSEPFFSFFIDLPAQCGGVLTASVGQIKSPGFQFSYPQNVNCLWIIRVPSAKSIRLFVNSFDLQRNCELDYMSLYKQGFYSPENGVDKYCGRKTGLKREVFDGGEVWIQYHAPPVGQNPVSSKGFSLRYEADIDDASTRPTISGVFSFDFVVLLMHYNVLFLIYNISPHPLSFHFLPRFQNYTHSNAIYNNKRNIHTG